MIEISSAAHPHTTCGIESAHIACSDMPSSDMNSARAVVMSTAVVAVPDNTFREKIAITERSKQHLISCRGKDGIFVSTLH